jgi:hypothetical protein
MVALATTSAAIIFTLIFVIGWVVYAFMNRGAGRAEIGSEIELAANRKKYYEDEELEGKRLERVQFFCWRPSRSDFRRTGCTNPAVRKVPSTARPVDSSRGDRTCSRPPPTVDSTVRVATVE